MKYTLLALFISVSVLAQPAVTVTDTIDVVTLQKFNIPEDRNIVLTNIKQISIQAQLFNSEFVKLRDVDEIFQTLSSEEVVKQSQDGRGVMVQVVANEAIEEPGVYYIKIDIMSIRNISCNIKSKTIFNRCNLV